jgi:hypothetical protein
MIQQLSLRLSHQMTCGFAIFFGLPGPLNDINISQWSHLFVRLVSGDTLACNYTSNGHAYTMGYYLADDIYPSWSVVKTVPNLTTRKQVEFSKAQEAC